MILSMVLYAVTVAGDVAPSKTTPTCETHVPIRCITPSSKPHWFGYYDKFQFDPSGRYVLGMESDFEGRTPTPDDTVRLGYVDLQDNDRWTAFGESRAWSWQQGCMLQWIPGSNDHVVYNDRDGDHFVSVIQNVFTGESRVLPRPIYCISPDGKTALSTNFARLDDTRPGYGYKGVADPGANNPHPDNDGIYAIDLTSGESKLIVTYDQIASIPQEMKTDGSHWFNHLLFNPDGSRFVFLHRAHPSPGQKTMFVTRMFTAEPDGSDLYCINDHKMVSHFIWRNPKQILAWSSEPDTGDRFHLYDDLAGTHAVIGEGVLKHDGHCTYSPDGQWILTDGYPDKNRMQPLMLFRPSDGKLVELGTFFQLRQAEAALRCDLHPRWSRDGTYVCIDSMHEGNRRQMYLLDFSGVVSGG